MKIGKVRGIEPPCAAWEAAVLPLNYTREEIFDFSFAIADCNRNKLSSANHDLRRMGVACAVLSAFLEMRGLSPLRTADATAGKLKLHCHEITSSSAVPAFLSAARPGALPDRPSLPNDQAITPIVNY